MAVLAQAIEQILQTAAERAAAQNPAEQSAQAAKSTGTAAEYAAQTAARYTARIRSCSGAGCAGAHRAIGRMVGAQHVGQPAFAVQRAIGQHAEKGHRD